MGVGDGKKIDVLQGKKPQQISRANLFTEIMTAPEEMIEDMIADIEMIGAEAVMTFEEITDVMIEEAPIVVEEAPIVEDAALIDEIDIEALTLVIVDLLIGQDVKELQTSLKETGREATARPGP